MAAVLVTGASGYIGRHVAASVTAAGDRVVRVPHRWRDGHELHHLVGDGPVDRCIHLGWYANPSDYLHAAEPNLASLANSVDLMRLLIDRGCRHLVVAGTSAEYGAPTSPVDESAPITPTTVYAAAKTALRVLLESSWRPAGMEVAWARIFNLTGPGEHPRRILPQVITALLQGTPIALTDGRQVRDFLHVADVAAALVALSSRAAKGAFNVSSGVGTPLGEILVSIADRVGAPRDLLRFGERARDPLDADVLVGVNERLRRCGWSPAFSLEATLDQALTHWREQLGREPAARAQDGVAVYRSI